MATVSCPRCDQLVDSQAITCPNCRIVLKAYGHPGIPLHRAPGKEYLCDTCTYHSDNTCNFPQRPYAKECILYQDLAQSQRELQQQRHDRSFGVICKNWLKRHPGLLLILLLLLICFVIALST